MSPSPKDIMDDKKTRDGFTLVEFMMAVSILAVGSVFVLRSFLSSASVLNMMGDRVTALQIAQSQMDEFEESAIKGELKTSPEESEQVDLNGRSAIKRSKVEEFSEAAWQRKVLKADVRLAWEESGREKEVSLARYLKNRE